MRIAKRLKLLACSTCLVYSAISGVQANPSGATVVHGTVSFSQPNVNTLNVTNSPGAIINWQQFGINQGELTRFIQQGANSAVLNRITGQDPSVILGQLSSNGKVYLVNPNGVVFGQGSMVNTAGLIASTLNISNQDFINGINSGTMRFADLKNAAEILNQGFISSSNGGEVVFVAPKITNEGTIRVDNGNIVLVAGQSVTINSLNFDNIEFEVQAPDNKVVNIGEMITDGGSVGVFAGSIVNKGRVSANAVTVDDAGNIIFVAQTDTVIENGTVTATSETGKGGYIEITGDRVALLGETTVDASGATGGGEVLVGGDFQGKNPNVKNSRQTEVSSKSIIRADAKYSGNGGKVIVWSDQNTYYSGSISARGGAALGNGGFVEVSGKGGLGFDGLIDTGAANGKIGSILLDPDVILIQAVAGQTNGAIGADVISALKGNITLFADIDITLETGATLNMSQGAGSKVIFQSGGDINIDGNIDIAGGDLLFSAADPSALTEITEPSPTATIEINGKITTNNGNVTLDNNNSSGLITINNDIDAGTGSIDLRSKKSAAISKGIIKASTFINNINGLMRLNGITIADITNNGNLMVDGSVIGDVINDGILSGSGTVTGNVTNSGDLNPGNPIGTFTIDGDLDLLPSSVLNIEIAGLEPGIEYDELIVTGNIKFDGKLNIIVDDTTGYAAQLQDSFDPIKYNSVSGDIVYSATKGYGYALTAEANKLNLLTVQVPGLRVPDTQSEVIVLEDILHNINSAEDTGGIETELVRSKEEADEKRESLMCS